MDSHNHRHSQSSTRRLTQHRGNCPRGLRSPLTSSSTFRFRPQAKQTRGDIACIPFGALTKLEEGADGEKIKTILEKGWVISKADVTVSKLKRKAPMPAVAEEGEEAEEQPQKRATPNHGVSPMSLARLKALVDGDAGE